MNEPSVYSVLQCLACFIMEELYKYFHGFMNFALLIYKVKVIRNE